MGIYRRGQVYYYDFRLDGIRHVKRVGPDKQRAKDAEDVARARLLEGRYEAEWGLRPRRPAPTVRAFIEKEFLPEAKTALAPSTFAVCRSHCKRFVETFGPLSLTRLGPDVLERYKAERLQAVSPAMLREDFRWLKAIVRSAIRRGHLRRDPLKGIRLPRRQRGPDRILATSEETRLLRVAHRVIKPVIRLALLTGLRRQELALLRIRDIHLDDHPRLVIVQPKTGAKKTVPLLPEAIRLLVPLCADRAPEECVFRTRFGRGFHPATFDLYFRAAVKTAKLNGLRFHDLRHTFATRLSQSGADLATVGDLLGHTPPYHETLRYFAHTSQSRKLEALRKLVYQQKSQRRSTKRKLGW